MQLPAASGAARRPAVYVAGPLLAARSLSDARRYYERLAGLAADAGLDPIVPQVTNDPERHADRTSVDVWDSDRAGLDRSRVVLAHTGAPSSGVGAEVV